MNLLIRRLFFTACIAIFLILAPFLLLYAIGYRYDFQRNKLVRTGVLLVESAPRGCSLYLDGKIASQKTPARINNLLPSDYFLEIKKDGYYEWQKKIFIYQNISTILRNVVLFKKDSPIKKLSEENVKQFKISTQKDKIAYATTDNKLWLFDLNSESNKLIYENKSSAIIEDFFLSTNSKQILIQITSEKIKNYLLVNLENKSTIDLNQQFALNLDEINWFNNDENTVYGLSANNLYNLNLNTKEKKLLIKENVLKYTIKDNFIYYIAKEENNLKFKMKNINSEKTDELFQIDSSENIMMINNHPDYIFLIDQKNQNLFLTDPKNNISPYDKLSNQAKSAQFSPDNKKILYYNDYEIWLYDLEKKESELITRTSSLIKEAIWHTSGQDIIYLDGGGLKIIEIQGPTRNIFNLLQSKISNLVIDKKGENIYFISEENGMKALSRLNIQ